MEQKPTLPMTPFDNLISTGNLQMLKLLLPYLPPANQKFFAIYIKFLELTHTVQYFNRFRTGLRAQSASGFPDPDSLLKDLRPYMNEQDAAAMEQMLNMMHMMELMKDMGVMDTSGASAGVDPMSIMMQMLSPDQQEMFESCQDMFQHLNSASDTTSKGADTDGSKLDESPGTEEYGSPETGTDQNSSTEDRW
ncbi:MAG TPA: hypothetical protein DCZ20_02400 [Lachnospiraceae bacterium]|nr:hypothetical protein [Lachnospiraceae bacterium]